ncbi:ferritin family protein [Flindersiella endophytica]
MTPDRDIALDPVRMPRRTVVRGALWTGAFVAGTGMITACDGPDPGSSESPTPTPKPDPDLPVVTAAVTRTRKLIERYTATAARHTGLRLDAYVARHRAHLKALSDGSAGPKPAPTPSPTGSPTPTATGAAVPGTPGAAVEELISLETAAAAERAKGLVRARNPELARLLASIGACETVHALTLPEVSNG